MNLVGYRSASMYSSDCIADCMQALSALPACLVFCNGNRSNFGRLECIRIVQIGPFHTWFTTGVSVQAKTSLHPQHLLRSLPCDLPRRRSIHSETWYVFVYSRG